MKKNAFKPKIMQSSRNLENFPRISLSKINFKKPKTVKNWKK